MADQGERKVQGVGYRKGTKVSVTRWKNHRTYKWRANYIEEGKHRSKGFTRKKDAEGWAKKREASSLSEGTNDALTHLERMTVIDTRKAIGELESDLRQVVEIGLDYLRRAKISCSVSEMVETVIRDTERAGRSARHVQGLKSKLNRFTDDFGDRPVATVDSDEIKDWLYGLDLAPGSINNFRRHLSILFNDAVKAGMIQASPMASIKKASEEDVEVEVLTPTELSRLLEKADDQILPYIAIGAFAGVRRSEADGHRLDWKDVDLKRMQIRVRAKRSKSPINRIIPITANLSDWLRPFAKSEGRVWPVNGNKLLRKAIRRAGFGEPGSETEQELKDNIKMLRPWPGNALRHSYASYWLEKNKDISELVGYMGHTGPAMIFQNYRSVVEPEDAETYWNIAPDKDGKVISISA